MSTSPAGPHAHPYRVLLVDLAHGFGGPETRVLMQARALQDRVDRCAVAVVRGSPLHERLRLESIPCEPVAAPRTDPRLALELRGVIRRGGYQLVDAHNIQSIFWGHLAALLAGARGRVTTLHSDYGEEYGGLRGILYPAVYRLMRPITRHFVHVTDRLQERAESDGIGARSTLIYNTVPVESPPPVARDPALLPEWGWTESDFVVASVGRFFPVKGHVHLVEAMAELRDLPAVKLLLVGDGPLREELEARVEALDLGERVRFLGFRPDVSRILRSVDCVCLPSLWELLPYAALEAAALARPIVATAVGGVPRMLPDGEAALLVAPRDERALAAAIRRLVEQPEEARRLGRGGYDVVRRSFGSEEMLRRTLEVYGRALA